MPSDLSERDTEVKPDEVAAGSGEPRFTPGIIIGGRYRIVSLLGRGGMGEVYRADDLKLGQRVALKFVPQRIASDRRAFERLCAEVRIGRQISHPNVCRIHDIVEIAGQHFIAMEYVDGEDLASLLRRIGRLPSDKALALTRDICAGLAAAHEKGIVHRDLKPANIMIDGEGHARIMDFGLAALVHELHGRREIAGTPAYMAPEQLMGDRITTRTDIYSLGLVLYEMHTGTRVFGSGTAEQILSAHAAAKARPTSFVREVEPAMERLILHCLEEDPDDRPPSTRAILASLPGGNPLDAALAAGQTPSPALVAAAGETGDLGAKQAASLLSVAILLLVAVAALSQMTLIPNVVSDIRSRDALRDRAREILASLGHPRPFGMDAWFETDDGYLAWLDEKGEVTREALATSPPSPIRYVVRTSPGTLVASGWTGQVWRDDPAETSPGMATIIVDQTGRLLQFQIVPEERSSESAAKVDWSRFFQESGLEMGSFVDTTPEWVPPHGSDERRAWTGAWPNRPDIAVRVEAASRAGKPVWFRVIELWDTPSRPPGRSRIPTIIFAAITFIAVVIGVPVARHNLARGRGDRRGAFRIAVFVTATIFVARFALASHSSDLAAEWLMASNLFAISLWRGLAVWVMALAVEPYIRRHWPRMLISSSRILAGRVRDPLVGREILVGTIFGALAAGAPRVAPVVLGWIGGPTVALINPLQSPAMDTPLGFAWIAIGGFDFALIFTYVFLTILVLFRLVLRSRAAALAGLWIVMAIYFLGGGEWTALTFTFALLTPTIFVGVLHRFGAFALVIAIYVRQGLASTPLTFDFSAWFAMRSLAVLALFASIAAWGYYLALAGKPALGGAMLDEREPA